MVATERHEVDEPPKLVKTQLAKIVAEVWARQLILDRFGLGEGKTAAPKPRGSHYILYDLAGGPKRHQVRRPRGVRVDMHYANIRGVIKDAIRASAGSLLKEQISDDAARTNFERWQAKTTDELVEFIKHGIAQDIAFQESRREDFAPIETARRDFASIDYTLVNHLIEDAGAATVASALWMYETLAGKSPWWVGLSRTFREAAWAGHDSSKRDFFMGAGSNFENIDLGLLEEVVHEPPWSLPRDLQEVIGNGHPDFVAIEAVELGKVRSRERTTSIWTEAHVFEIKANAGKMTPTQEDTLARAQRFAHIHYTLLHFDFDMSVGPTTITEIRYDEA